MKSLKTGGKMCWALKYQTSLQEWSFFCITQVGGKGDQRGKRQAPTPGFSKAHLNKQDCLGIQLPRMSGRSRAWCWEGAGGPGECPSQPVPTSHLLRKLPLAA